MKLYALLDDLFPRSFLLKAAAITISCIHLPLLAVFWLVALPELGFAQAIALFVPAFMVLVAGTVLAGYGLHVILRPIGKISSMIESYKSGRMIAPLPQDHDDEVGSLMCSVSSLISAVDLRLARAEELARTDPLTSMLNRSGLETAAEGVTSAAVLMIDIDHFKVVNDQLGHLVGDSILKCVARAIRDSLRGDDFCGRYGGEEFLVVAPGATHEQGLEIGQRIRAAVRERTTRFGHPVTISIGLSASVSGMRMDTLIAHADAACYRAKRAGRDRIETEALPSRRVASAEYA